MFYYLDNVVWIKLHPCGCIGRFTNVNMIQLSAFLSETASYSGSVDFLWFCHLSWTQQAGGILEDYKVICILGDPANLFGEIAGLLCAVVHHPSHAVGWYAWFLVQINDAGYVESAGMSISTTQKSKPCANVSVFLLPAHDNYTVSSEWINWPVHCFSCNSCTPNFNT